MSQSHSAQMPKIVAAYDHHIPKPAVKRESRHHMGALMPQARQNRQLMALTAARDAVADLDSDIVLVADIDLKTDFVAALTAEHEDCYTLKQEHRFHSGSEIFLREVVSPH